MAGSQPVATFASGCLHRVTRAARRHGAIPTGAHAAMRGAAVVLALAGLLPGCSPVRHEPGLRELAVRQALLETALGQIGRPYRYGGGDGDGFDCSGLVHFVYSEAGVTVPRTAADQRRAGRKVPQRELQPGDAVFFDVDGGLHVALYVGDGRVIHAPSRGKDVRLTALALPYWRERYAGAVTLLDF
ncbi:MAG TPA: C40 family peptidase [Candidatus Binatia bacterium]|nr:C40 family peptidase [Candidatus Binatia bacterium]